MSKLDGLLKEFCPNGVEYKNLRDVATISRGGSFQKKDYVEKSFPCIHYGQIYTLNILVRGNRSSGKSETDSPEHWKPPNVSLLA